MSYIAEFDEEINEEYPMDLLGDESNIVWMWVNEDDDVALFYDEDALHTVGKPWKAKQYVDGFLSGVGEDDIMRLLGDGMDVIVQSEACIEWADALNQVGVA